MDVFLYYQCFQLWSGSPRCSSGRPKLNQNLPNRSPEWDPDSEIQKSRSHAFPLRALFQFVESIALPGESAGLLRDDAVYFEGGTVFALLTIEGTSKYTGGELKGCRFDSCNSEVCVPEVYFSYILVLRIFTACNLKVFQHRPCFPLFSCLWQMETTVFKMVQYWCRISCNLTTVSIRATSMCVH